MNNNAKNKTKQIVGIGVMTAIIAVLSQITIPLPTHVPVTLQTFAVALAGYFLGWKGGAVSALVYGLLGAIGVPVFAGWSGGFSVIVGYTGGFIYGFIVMALLCGLGAKFCSDKISGKVIAIVLGIAGLACDHLLGAIQYAIVANICFCSLSCKRRYLCCCCLPYQHRACKQTCKDRLLCLQESLSLDFIICCACRFFREKATVTVFR